uniref:Uncharacterized protein n=1 Tax=Scophthalmus maximus TaxID=52904 RepID=A0A8D3B9U0_SCOMX
MWTDNSQVDQEPGGADGDHHHGALDLVRLRDALDHLQQDGEAQRREEHGVDQRAHHLGADPAERVLVGRVGLLGEAHRHQRHDQRDDIRQHVEGVGQHGQRRGDAADHHLHDEEAESQRQHAEQPHAVRFTSHGRCLPVRSA